MWWRPGARRPHPTVSEGRGHVLALARLPSLRHSTLQRTFLNSSKSISLSPFLSAKLIMSSTCASVARGSAFLIACREREESGQTQGYPSPHKDGRRGWWHGRAAVPC